MTSDPFNYFYTLNAYDCLVGVADDLELQSRFLERVVDKIGMHCMLPPKMGVEVEKAEVLTRRSSINSEYCGESNIQLISIESKRFINIDVSSCNPFDKKTILDYAQECFGFEKAEDHYFVRDTEIFQ